MVCVTACVEAQLDVGELFTMATILQQLTHDARVELGAEAPLHPRCGIRHDTAEACPSVPA
jgi:hypothetical protein